MRRQKPAKLKTLKGSELSYNVAAQLRYSREIRTLVKEMTREVKTELIDFFKTPVATQFYEEQKQAAKDSNITDRAKIITDKLTSKFTGLFTSRGKTIAEQMVNNANRLSTSKLNSSLEKLTGDVSLKTNFQTPGLFSMTQAAVTENVGLITSIAEEYLKDVTGAVMRSITTGGGLKDLVPALQQYRGISERKAANIALDQTRKVYNMTNKSRMQEVGVKKFEWIHSGGGAQPRKSHQAIDGKIYSFDKLPVINKEEVTRGKPAVRGIPGQAINCGCTMRPVITFDEEEN